MIAYLFDHDSSDQIVVQVLKGAGILVFTARELSLERIDDELLLRYASDQRLTVVTPNARDFDRLHRAWLTRAEHHAGIVVVQQQRWSAAEVARRLAFIASVAEPSDFANRLEHLTHWAA